MPRRTGSSQRWRQRQERDIYVEQANRAGWRSRAVFKLEQIQAKERLLRSGTVCVMVAYGTPCLGPVTHAGCGAICPAYARGCYGCFGPRESANAAGLASHYLRSGDRAEEVGRRFAGFAVNQEPFRSVVVAMDRLHGAHGPREGSG